MTWKLFKRLSFISLLASIVVFSELAWSEQGAEDLSASQSELSDNDLSSPRQTMKTFLTAMESVQSGNRHGWDLAIKCLDLSEFSPFVRDSQGQDLAVKLLGIINRTRYVIYENIPDYQEGESYKFRKDEAGEVTISHLGKNWKFSKSTVKQIPELYRLLENERIVKGVTSAENLSLSLTIRQKVPEFLKQQRFLVEDWQWLGIVLVLGIGYLLKLVLAIIFNLIARRLFDKLTFLASAENFKKAATPAAYFVLASAVKIATSFLDLSPNLESYILVFLNVVQVITGMLILYRVLDVVAELLVLKASKTSTTVDDLLIPLFQKISKVLLIILTVILVANAFNFNVTGLVAGLGLGGLAFALAAKDTVENLFGSVTVLLDQPFATGDYINLEGVEGTVEHIGLRSTRLRTPDNSLISVPNSRLISSMVNNLGARRYRRIRTTISITYDTPVVKIEEFCDGIRNLIRTSPVTRKDYFHVHLNQLAASSLDILLNVYLEVPDYSIELEERGKLLLDIIKLAESMGIEFAFPTQTLHIASR